MAEQKRANVTNSYWCGKPGKIGPPRQPNLPGPQNYCSEIAWRRNAPQQPKWSLAIKPEMVIGGVVPSWVNSIPGPKYSVNPDTYKQTMPSWSIPGRGNIPGGPLALQGMIKHECDQLYKQAVKDMPSGAGTMSSPQLLDQRASFGICGCNLAQFANLGRTGSVASLPASRILQSSGKSQLCSVGSRRTGRTGLTGVSSASLRDAVALEVAKQMQPSRDDLVLPLRNERQAKTRQQRLEDLLSHAQDSFEAEPRAPIHTRFCALAPSCR